MKNELSFKWNKLNELGLCYCTRFGGYAFQIVSNLQSNMHQAIKMKIEITSYMTINLKVKR